MTSRPVAHGHHENVWRIVCAGALSGASAETVEPFLYFSENSGKLQSIASPTVVDLLGSRVVRV